MASGAIILYAANLADLNITDLLSKTVKMALVTSAYTPDASETGHAVWADVSGQEIAAGNGYTAGGLTLTNDVATAIAGGFKYASDEPVWTAAGGSIPAFRYGVMYVSGSLWGKTSPVLGYFLADTTPADVPATPAGALLTVVCPAAGWFTVTRGA